MPLAPGSQQEFAELYTKVNRCVVYIDRSREVHDKKKECFGKDNEMKPGGTGFVVHETQNITVIACHSSCISENSRVSVFFPDGKTSTRNEVVALGGGGMNLIFCDIPKGEWKSAQYSHLKEENEVGIEPEVVLTIVSGPVQTVFTGQIISSHCSAIDRNGLQILKTNQLFCFNLPVGGSIDQNEINLAKQGWKHPTGYVPGAPVFNMDGDVVGFVHECSSAFDMKYSMRIESFTDDLNNWLGGRTWEDAIGATFKTLDEIFDWY